jgi:hypothetical protein
MVQAVNPSMTELKRHKFGWEGKALEAAPGSGVVLEEAAAADILADLFERTMAGLFHDGALPKSSRRRRTTSERRKAPANPTSSNARSLRRAVTSRRR